MKAAVTCRGLVKRYGRRAPRPALDGLDAMFPEGRLCGLVGPNGAGKTTLFSILTGFLPADAGEVDVLGLAAFDPFRHKGRVGVLPQDAAIDERLTPFEWLHLLGGLQGLDDGVARAEASRTLRELNLAERGKERIGTLSHGMRRRLSVASALIGRPELVLLDEPTAGLDPAQAASLRAVLRGLAGRATVIVSSHDLGELERICGWIVLVAEGRCVRQGPVEGLLGERARLRYEVGGAVPIDTLRERLIGHEITVADGGRFQIEAPPEADLDHSALVTQQVLTACGVVIRGVSRGQSLEEGFLAATTRERTKEGMGSAGAVAPSAPSDTSTPWRAEPSSVRSAKKEQGGQH